MSDDDPALLFTPVKRAQRKRLDFVQAPSMSSAEKVTYKTRQESSIPQDTVEVEIDEIIGEYAEDKLYYYARYKGGIAHKVCLAVWRVPLQLTRLLKFWAEAIRQKYPHLVDEYHRKQLAGELERFDPAAHYVHPKSRVRMVVSIGKDGARVNISSNGSVPPSSDMGEVPDSEMEEDEEVKDDEEDEYAEDEDESVVKLPKRNLPFSPKKTHSDDDDEDAEDVSVSTNAPTRRSTRSRKEFKVNLDESAYDESEQDDDHSEGYRAPRSKATAKKRAKPARNKGARPAYGHFRVVADLDYDPNSDEETTALREHRGTCEKCHMKPAHVLLDAERKRPKGKGRRKKKTSDDEFEESGDEVERLTKKGGWVRCLKCPVVAHWNCLASTQREEILKAARDIDRAAWRSTQPENELHDENGQPKANKNEPGKRAGLDPYQTTEFVCGACTRGGVCMGCMETALEPDANNLAKGTVAATNSSVEKDAETIETSSSEKHDLANELLFRCLVCKRLAHYAHLPLPPDFPADSDVAEIAVHYQHASSWLCADCSSFTFGLDKILAWRPYPSTAVEPPRPADEPVNYKNVLPREYLVKWTDRSYRRTQWVPHMWLVSTNGSKLKTSWQAVPNSAPFQIVVDSRDSSVKPGGSSKSPTRPQDAVPDAERRIPPAWKTVDRVLDLLLWRPRRAKAKTQKRTHKKGKGQGRRVETDDESDEAEEDEAEAQRAAAFDQGEQPSTLFTESLGEWEGRTRQKFSIDHIDEVAWVFIKWNDLPYDEASWDSPPRSSEPGYAAFKTALQRFIASREVKIPVREGAKASKFDDRVKEGYAKHRLKDASDLKLGQDPVLKLMDFQVDGFNWLCDNWWNHQHCILADEMGLGKTVQIATFVGKVIQDFEAAPALVVVPNSTITNWVREFERWAPNLRVVPFYGEAKAREANVTSAKFHVLVTTYEALLNPKDFTSVFRNQPRWEVLIIDEGQRLKSDGSLLFRKLGELNSIHRIIMTGTPLNNNLRELFNLMSFLDPSGWNDLEELTREYETLTEDLVKQLHNRLRPYFLRRIKSQVLKLPPKNEVIVPLSMAPLQKEIYRSILSHNLDLLNGLTGPTKANGAPQATRLTSAETHEKLIDASAKLRFLKVLLPKLKARGHRVLLFSQFVIALDVIEDFLNGEEHKYLRLDGNTKGKDRQKGMDEFNREGSDIFIYLLTTRAGGVGINLFTADTVIIFDPDFNPHQAIARAYRYGQKNTCLVFKLMIKRIVQVGKKKLVLDHLIVQTINDDDGAGDNVQSILTYGAQALFEADADTRDKTFTDAEIDKLIDKTEQEAEPEQVNEEGALSFSFAKIWSAEKDSLEDVVEDDGDQGDSWAQTLQKISADQERTRAQDIALSGRGARRRAAAPKLIDPAGPLSPIQNYDNSEPCALCGLRHGDGSRECMMTEKSELLAEFREMLLLHPEDEPLDKRLAAISAIDEVLHQRGHLALIQGQPLEIVQRSTAVLPPKKKPKISTNPSQASGQTSRPSDSSKASLDAPKASGSNSLPSSSAVRLQSQSMPVAGPSKPCVICRISPLHLAKDCPIVAEGPKSVSREIKRLDLLSGTAGTVQILRKILAKQKKQELSQATVIDISD
ncbi:SNF2 family N-terminal domain-containing protein [Mycena sp. CBHHK59/15]|nr:SNF2 family N-terminal domain-containing protein [Mycena sp. CBHHK59/15]